MRQRSMTLLAASKTALRAAYGPQRVSQWQAEGEARRAGKQARIDSLKRKNGQIR